MGERIREIVFQMTNDLVSIIMPSYNCGKYVEETIRSVDTNVDYCVMEVQHFLLTRFNILLWRLDKEGQKARTMK